MKTKELLKKISSTLEEKKATDIKIYNVANLTSLYEYLLIASSKNTRHVKSLTDEMLNLLKEEKINHKNIEKDENFTWVVLDCTNVIIHLFYEQTREFYNLDSLFKDCLEFSI